MPFAIIESPVELLVILLVALLLFGHRLPSVARSLGQSINEFKKGAREGEAQQSQNSSSADGAATPTTPPTLSRSNSEFNEQRE